MLAALPPLVALVFWRGSQDVFNTPKAALAVSGVALLAGVELIRPRPRALPRAVRVALAVYASGLIVGTLAAPSLLQAVVGLPGRHTGLALGLATIALFVISARRARPRLIAGALVAGSVPVALYALVQAGGRDPFRWAVVEGGPQVFSTLGNAGFLSAWLGMCIPLALWLGLSPTSGRGVRVAAGAAAILAVPAMLSTASAQGPIVAGAGILPLALARVLTRRSPPAGSLPLALTRGRVLAFALVGVVAVAALVAVLAVEPLREGLVRSLQTRTWKWTTAVSMASARPFTGVGLDSYIDWFYAYRPIEVAVEQGIRRPTDAAHNVPLNLLAGGGLLAGLGWLAAVAAVTTVVGRAWLHASGEQRLGLSAVGGAWVGYLLQALVSLDITPLAVTGWTLGGAAVALALPQPAAPAEARPRRMSLALPVVVLVAVASVIPLRADLTAGQGVRAMALDQPERALVLFDRAAAVAPWEPAYALSASDAASVLTDWPAARSRAREAVRRGPRRLGPAVRLAQLEASLALSAESDRAYERVLAIDSRTPDTLLMVAEYELRRERPRRSAALIERALAVQPERPDLWRALGQARRVAGDTAGARRAFARATSAARSGATE